MPEVVLRNLKQTVWKKTPGFWDLSSYVGSNTKLQYLDNKQWKDVETQVEHIDIGN